MILYSFGLKSWLTEKTFLLASTACSQAHLTAPHLFDPHAAIAWVKAAETTTEFDACRPSDCATSETEVIIGDYAVQFSIRYRPKELNYLGETPLTYFLPKFIIVYERIG